MQPFEIPQKEDFDTTSFLGLGFTHHMTIVRKNKEGVSKFKTTVILFVLLNVVKKQRSTKSICKALVYVFRFFASLRMTI